MLKGQARFVFENYETGETREVQSENFIFESELRSLIMMNNGPEVVQPAILEPNNTSYPIGLPHEKNWQGVQYPSLLTGEKVTNLDIIRFYPKSGDQPNYIEFTTMFRPDSVDRIIGAVGLTSDSSSNDSESNPIYRISCINLNPPCIQKSNEFLTIYYRVILLEDGEDLVPNQYKAAVLRNIIDRQKCGLADSLSYIWYPYPIAEVFTEAGKVRTLDTRPLVYESGPGFITDWQRRYTISDANSISKSVEWPNKLNDALYAMKVKYFPAPAPFQYEMNVGAGMKTMIRTNSNSSYRGPSKNQVGFFWENFTPEIGQGWTGISPVFSKAGESILPMFDPSFFPVGSGLMNASGTWTGGPYATHYEVFITQTGTTASTAKYQYRKTRLAGGFNGNRHEEVILPLPLLPSGVNEDNGTLNQDLYGTFKDFYSLHWDVNHLRAFNRNDPSFITWDLTGITIYSIGKGTTLSVDKNTTPALSVTAIVDVKVDINQNIWVACAATGLWKVTVAANSVTVTHIGELPGSLQKCYAIDSDNFGNVWAIFWGTGLFYTQDGGDSWVNVAINISNLSDFTDGDSNWKSVSKLMCNPYKNATTNEGELLILRKPTSPGYSTLRAVWFNQSTSTPTINNSPEFDFMATNPTREYSFYDNLNSRFVFVGSGGLRKIIFAATTPPVVSWNFSSGNTGGIGWETVLNRNTFLEETIVYVQAGYVKYAIDVGSNVVRNSRETRVPSTGPSEIYQTSCCIMMAKNIFLNATGKNKNVISINGHECTQFQLTTFFPALPGFEELVYDWYGWNGANWQKDFEGSKTCSVSYEPLEKGVSIKFTNGSVGTTSFHEGDKYTFLTSHGYIKDNASRIEIKDSVYMKPKRTVTTFSPSSVALRDYSSEIGIIHSSNANNDWNLDQLPDTTYFGTSVNAAGDKNWYNVYLWNDFTKTGFADSSPNDNAAVATFIGSPAYSTMGKYDSIAIELNGTNGVKYSSTVSDSGIPCTNAFTIECDVNLTSVPQGASYFTILSFASGESLQVGPGGLLVFDNKGSKHGGIGIGLPAGSYKNVCVTRDEALTLRGFVDGVMQWSVANVTGTMFNQTMFDCRVGIKSDGSNGFVGLLDNLRMTRNVARYVGNYTISTDKFLTYAPSIPGSALTFTGLANEGGVWSKKRLVGDFTVVFSEITSTLYNTVQNRANVIFGISSFPRMRGIHDMQIRIHPQGTSVVGEGAKAFTHLTARLQTFDCKNGTNSSKNGSQPNTFAFTGRFFRIRRIARTIYVDVSTNGSTWSTVWTSQPEMSCPVYYVQMWQVGPTACKGPAVEIVENGSGYFSDIGDSVAESGVFDPKFLAADTYWAEDFDISIGGAPATNKRSIYFNDAAPGKGEAYVHQHGYVVFNSLDAGKSITGKVVTLKD